MTEDTEKRLNELLEQKDNEIHELAEKVQVLEARLDHEYGDIFPADLPARQSLPVPRLEMVWTPSEKFGWGRYSVVYRLVYRHFTGHCVGVVLGETRVSGGCNREPLWDSGRPSLPFRDGAHIHSDSLSMKLPAYYVYPGKDPGRIVWSAEQDSAIRSSYDRMQSDEEKREEEEAKENP